MAGKCKASPRGRDSETGHLIPVEQARRQTATPTVERVPKPGYGDTKGDKKRR